MKKLIILLVVVCLVFAGFLTYLSYSPKTITANVEEAVEENTEELESISVSYQALDYEAIYALHDPDEIIMTVDGTEISWSEYFSWLYMSAIQTEQYFAAMANYGVEMNWADIYDEDANQTYADVALSGAESTLKQLLTIIGYASSKDITANAETLNAMVEQRESDKISVVGEDGTEEDFLNYLASLYRSEGAYQRTNLANYINQQAYTELYGENAENVSDEQAISYLEENEYMYASHILLGTIDFTTGEALDEEAIAAKKAQAEEIAAELQAIEDTEELMARFKELKDEYCEDTGKDYFPDGYVFQEGTMVTEFEDSVKSLAEYQVSDPVETSYGYHIIIRLPFNPDAIVSYSSSTGAASTARDLYASYDYAQALQEYLDNIQVQYVDGYEPVDLTQFIVEK